MTSPLAAWLVVFLMTGLVSGSPTPPAEPVTLTGRVVVLTEALKSIGVGGDSEPILKQVVLESQDGAIIPLLSDDASRALFLDKRLRDRAAEVKGLRRRGLPYIQVVSFQIEENGRLRTPEYYCEVCTISVRFPQTCPCCQGAMELRMKPETR